MATPTLALAHALAAAPTEAGAAWTAIPTDELRAGLLAVRLEAVERSLSDLARGCLDQHPAQARILLRHVGALGTIRDDLHRLDARDRRRR